MNNFTVLDNPYFDYTKSDIDTQFILDTEGKKKLNDQSLWTENGSIVIEFLDQEQLQVKSKFGNKSIEGTAITFGFLDPPLSSFDFNGVTYNLSEFKDSIRNGCTLSNCNPNLGYKPGAVVLHQFMHVLGALHQNVHYTKKNICMDALYPQSRLEESGVCNGLGSVECDRYIVDNFYKVCNLNDKNECSSSNYDKDSIMLYMVYDQFTNIYNRSVENPMKINFELSKRDKEWLKQRYSGKELVITVKFKNGKEWQKAHVAKMVKEKLEPYTGGVKFNFVDFPGSNKEGLGTKEIVGIVVGIILFLLLVGYISYDIIINLKDLRKYHLEYLIKLFLELLSIILLYFLLYFIFLFFLETEVFLGLSISLFILLMIYLFYRQYIRRLYYRFVDYIKNNYKVESVESYSYNIDLDDYIIKKRQPPIKHRIINRIISYLES
jgi:hypothetical protein